MNIDEVNAAYYKPDSKAAQSAVSLANNFDDFLTLLTTQLANQDPLNPTDSNEFTNQLVSFTQVEQSISANQNLEALIQLQSTNQQNAESSALINYLGKNIGSNLNAAKLENGQASWQLDFGATADSVTYEIYDANGNRVYSEAASSAISKGPQQFSWDGSLYNSGQAPEGAYYLKVKAVTDGGSNVDISYKFEGLASKMETLDGRPVLIVDDIPLSLADITSVQIANTTN